MATTPWTRLLKEAIEEYALDLGENEVPLEHFREWLAEWGHEARNRQEGVLLLTAHRAKGLEFDHVVVLDGGWSNRGRNEDDDARRRLFYVAITRARATLTLMRRDAGHPFLDVIEDAPMLHRRTQMSLPEASLTPERNYRTLSLKEIDLGYAGRRADSNRLHGAIAALSAGDPLTLRDTDGRKELLDARGTVVGRLSSQFKPPKNTRPVEARVHAIVIWRRDDSDERYQSSIRCDRWEVVVPTLVFEEA